MLVVQGTGKRLGVSGIFLHYEMAAAVVTGTCILNILICYALELLAFWCLYGHLDAVR